MVFQKFEILVTMAATPDILGIYGGASLWTMASDGWQRVILRHPGSGVSAKQLDPPSATGHQSRNWRQETRQTGRCPTLNRRAHSSQPRRKRDGKLQCRDALARIGEYIVASTRLRLKKYYLCAIVYSFMASGSKTESSSSG